MDERVGRWELTGVAEQYPSMGTDWDVEFPDDGGPGIATFGDTRVALDELLHRWLAGAEFANAPAPVAAGGLVLEITPDATFTETGAAAVPWFDVDGVLEAAAVPFAGTVTGHGYLLAAGVEPTPLPDRPHVVRRYDDGDTQVTDTVAAGADELVRTVSVVTDELYPSRIRYTYMRA